MLSVIREDRSKDACIAATWKQEWEPSRPTRVHRHVSDREEGVKGEDLNRKHWTTLNILRTGVGRYRSSTNKWGLADSAACDLASQNRQLTTSPIAAHYIDHHPKLASSKLAIDQSIAYGANTELTI